MKPIVKASLTGAGYLAAFAIASVVVGIHMVATNGPDRQSSSGMYAFGDSVLFLAVFAIAAIPATCAALFFLRQCSSFWIVLSVVAAAIAVTGAAALIEYVVGQSKPNAWSGVAVLRMFVAPLFALGFLVAGIFAPSRFARVALLLAAASDAAVICCIFLIWLK